MNLLSPERAEYYKKKKQRLAVDEASYNAVKEDAAFIEAYGMDAYLDLFPEAEGNPISWHRDVLKAIYQQRRNQLADALVGINLAVGGAFDKKAARRFRRFVKQLKR